MEQSPSLRMMTEQEVKERTSQIPGMATAYFNHARMSASFYDVRIFFGQTNINPTGSQAVEEQLSVILTPECAKMIGQALISTVDQYEKIFGALRPLPAPRTTTIQDSLGTPAPTQKKKKKEVR